MGNVIMGIVGLLLLITGCADTLGEIRATEPLRTGTYQRPVESLADCTKRQIETAPWAFGQPTVQLSRDPDAIRVNALSFTSMLFEVTFRPTAPAATMVEYRRGYHGHGTEDRTWAIIEACAAQS